MWSSEKYEFKLNDTTTKPLLISIAQRFIPNLKPALYTKDGLPKFENLIPSFYSLKSGIYLDSLAPEAKVVIYDAAATLEGFTVASLISSASYILLILSANVKLSTKFKHFVSNLIYVIKQRISQIKNGNND